MALKLQAAWMVGVECSIVDIRLGTLFPGGGGGGEAVVGRVIFNGYNKE